MARLASASAFAFLALALACLGAHGVLWYIAWRTPEIGIRLVLAAQAGDIRWICIAGGGSINKGLGCCKCLVQKEPLEWLVAALVLSALRSSVVGS
jgi:hypothetical protein